MKQLLPLLPLLVLIGTAGVQPVAAQDEAATVRLQGRSVLRVGAAPDQDPAARARRIERRLEQLLENTLQVPSARVLPGATQTERVISIGDVPVITVTAADAEDNVMNVDALARAWASAVDSALVRAAAEQRTGWSAFTTRVEAAFRAAFSRLRESATRIIPGAPAATLVLLVFWILASVLRRLLRSVTERTIRDKTAKSLVRQLSYYVVWAVGIVVAAGALGFEPENVVTGLGLTSLALGFALKDILSNFVSGMLLLGLRPFELGDQIVVGSTEGTVERIELRATQIRTYDGRVVYVPNAEIFTSRLTNNTAAPVRQASVTVPLGYEQDVSHAASVFVEAASATKGVLPDPPAKVRLRELGPADVMIEVTFWTDSRRSDYAETTAAVRSNIVEAAKHARIGLPAPNARTLTFEELGGGEELKGTRRYFREVRFDGDAERK